MYKDHARKLQLPSKEWFLGSTKKLALQIEAKRMAKNLLRRQIKHCSRDENNLIKTLQKEKEKVTAN